MPTQPKPLLLFLFRCTKLFTHDLDVADFAFRLQNICTGVFFKIIYTANKTLWVDLSCRLVLGFHGNQRHMPIAQHAFPACSCVFCYTIFQHGYCDLCLYTALLSLSWKKYFFTAHRRKRSFWSKELQRKLIYTIQFNSIQFFILPFLHAYVYKAHSSTKSS
jgi:hypothetical protein